MQAEAIDPNTGRRIIVEIEDERVDQLYRELKSKELPKKEIDHMIDNLAISADAKAFIADLMDKTIRIGDRILRIGKKIIELTFDFVKRYPNATFGLILGFIVSLLVSAIPLLGAILGPLVSPIILLFGLASGFMDDFRDQALDRKIREAIQPFEALKGLA